MSREELEWYEHYMRQDKEELVDMVMTRDANIENYQRQIKKLKQEVKEWSRTMDTFSKREYAHRYLEERKKEIPNLLALDSDEIYREYYKLRDRIDKAIEYMKYNATSNYFDEEKNMFRREIDLLEILKGDNNE